MKIETPSETISIHSEDDPVSPLPKSPDRSLSKGLSIDMIMAPKGGKTPLRRKSSGVNYFLNSMKFEKEKKPKNESDDEEQQDVSNK